jgi:hypothetical protein
MDKKITCIFGLLLFSCCLSFLSDCTQTTPAQVTKTPDQKKKFPMTAVLESKSILTYQQVLAKLESLAPGKTIEVRMGTEKEQYDLGEPFEIRFMASKESYIILMYISADGNITFLAPSRQIPPDTRIKGGQVYSTGSPSRLTSKEEALYDLGIRLMTAPPGGVETINLFCSTEKIDLFESDFNKEPFYTIVPNDETRLQELLNRLDQLKQYEWSGTSVKIRIGPEPKFKTGVVRGKTKEIPRKFGALPPIGSTGTTGKFFPPIGSTGTTGKTDKEEVN